MDVVAVVAHEGRGDVRERVVWEAAEKLLHKLATLGGLTGVEGGGEGQGGVAEGFQLRVEGLVELTIEHLLTITLVKYQTE